MKIVKPKNNINIDLYEKIKSSIKLDFIHPTDKDFYTRTRSLSIHKSCYKDLGESFINIKKENLSILEIGCGYGRIQVELKKENQTIEYLGVCRENLTVTKDNFRNIINYEEMIKQVNGSYKDISIEELENMQLNDLLYYDIVGEIPFVDSNSIDLILSLYTYNVIPRPDLLFQDILRMLKIGGVAVIPTLNVPLLDKEGIEIQFVDYLKEQGFDIYCTHIDHIPYIKKIDNRTKINIEPLIENNKIISYVIGD